MRTSFRDLNATAALSAGHDSLLSWSSAMGGGQLMASSAPFCASPKGRCHHILAMDSLQGCK